MPEPQEPSPDPIDLRVASRLGSRRRALGVDPRTLDIVLGEPLGTVARIEAGLRRITSAQLFRLGLALDVDLEYFFAEGSDGHGAAGGEVAVAGVPAAAQPAMNCESEERRPDVQQPVDARAFAEAERFARAFAMLPDATVRRMVLDLIKTVAESDGT